MDKVSSSEHGLPRILLIDDEPGICMALSLLLHDLFVVEAAMTAAEGLARAREPFALILMDLCMPGVTRYELLEAIRQIAGETPIAVLSAMGDLRTREDVLRHGAAALIEKPFSRQELLRHIGAMLTSGEAGHTDAGV